MQLKPLLLSCLLIISAIPIRAQTEVLVRFTLSDKVAQTEAFRFSIQTPGRTVPVFSSHLAEEIRETHLLLPEDNGPQTGLFEYRSAKGDWKSVSYRWEAAPSGLKRIEIQLSFGLSPDGTEYLKDFSVDQFYRTNSVSIHSDQLEVGFAPVFTLVNHSDTTYYGASPSRHFYGTISKQTTYYWLDYSGSFCASTVALAPLSKSDTAYSWVPSYSADATYTLPGPGTYRYKVPLAIAPYTDGIPLRLFQSAETRKRIRSFVELETEFTVR